MRFKLLLFRQIYFFFFNYFIMTQTIGSRRQVWNGTAKRTSGGLTKSDLMMSHGRIVSKSKHFSAKKEMRLLKHGYGTQKGKFGYVKIGTKKHRKGSKKMRGGHSGINMALSPSGIDGQGITDYSASGSLGVQDAAGMAGGRRRIRRMMGGSGMGVLSPAGVDASYMIKDVVPQPFGPLQDALMAGGKRRRHRKMRGGTTSIRSQLSPLDLQADPSGGQGSV
jgi:hypothetical protein